MAEDKKVTYEIIIDTKGASLEQSPTEPEEQKDPTIVEQFLQLRKTIKGVAGFSIATGLAKQAFDWTTSMVLRDEGNSALQQRVNTIMSLTTQTAAMGGGFALSVMTGNALGMIASVGAAMHSLMGYVREIEQNQYDKKWETTEIMLRRERGGSALNRSRL